MAADGGNELPAALRSDLSVFHKRVNIDELPEPPAGQFTRVRRLADGILGGIDLFRWQRGGRKTVITQTLRELEQAIVVVQRAADTGDAAELTEFARGLKDGGGLLRTALAMHGWDRGARAFKRHPNLVVFHDELLQARTRLAEQLQDVLVVGKVMPRKGVRQNVGRQTNEAMAYINPRGPPQAPHPEDAMTEIGVLSYLLHQEDLPVYLLRLLGVFMDKGNVLMVTEFADGGELFLHVMRNTMAFNEERVMRYAWQLLQATRYLHAHHIGHRDISLENILVTFGTDVDGQIRLMDFGQAVQTHSLDGQEVLRFFIRCGKDYYRAPECYIPPKRQRALVLPPVLPSPREVAMAPLQDPAGYVCEVRLPDGYTPGEPCVASLWGYAATPLDVLSCGVAIFILAFRAQPWKMAVLADPHFKWITNEMRRRPGALERLVRTWPGRQPLSGLAMELMESMMQMDPANRPSIEKCLQSEWFAPMAGAPVLLHQARDPVPNEVVAEGTQGEAAGGGSAGSGNAAGGSSGGAAGGGGAGSGGAAGSSSQGAASGESAGGGGAAGSSAAGVAGGGSTLSDGAASSSSGAGGEAQ